MNRSSAFALAISVALALVGVACRPANVTQSANPASANSAASSTNRQTYEVKGVVKEVMPERKKAKIAAPRKANPSEKAYPIRECMS